MTNRDEVAALVRAWVDDQWDPELSLIEWRRKLLMSGWAVPSWPSDRFGRDLPAWADALARDTIVEAGAVATPIGGGTALAAPTINAFGSQQLWERFVPATLTGEISWCQLFSEPGAGSDLAGLVTQASLDGDEWVVSGQKVWNTSAHHADYGLLLARTDWDAPKHRGITYLLLPMDQPGVEVRPLRQMNRYASFNEVFISGARVPASNVVGGVNDGWRVALATLAFERQFGALTRPPYSSSGGRALDEARQEADSHFETYHWYSQRAGRVDLLASEAKRTGADASPVVRQMLARIESVQRIADWTLQRAQAARAAGRAPGAEGSIAKLLATQIARLAAEAHAAIHGPNAQLAASDGACNGLIEEILVSVPAQSIAGGTDEIQRNIIGEKSLGLPAEPSLVKHAAFRDMPRNG